MAFGFGFNKTKVLAAAERHIQQGKLQNAIAEYEKVVKSDPKDLTVLNTIGDLYARIGQTDKAVSYFKSVGDTYAAQGFTVKAIAMYKKLTKLKPSIESVLKLAELYGQQGLQNDARAQYLMVAEQYLHSGRLEQAAHAFQKILEIDPENTSLQVRLADVYVRLERRDEARKILLRTAEGLQARGSKAEAEEVLARVFQLDPADKSALLMRANGALQAGDFNGAIQALEHMQGLEEHADGLRILANAYLHAGRTAEAGPLAKKLFALTQDAGPLANYADALMKAGEYEEALRVYHQYAEKLLTPESSQVLDNLHACLDHIRDNVAALELLRQLYERADDKPRLAEVAELLAGLAEQSGDMARARDLYLQLAALDPNNPAYTQKYNSMVKQVGADAGHGETAAPLSVEDLNINAPEVDQGYSAELMAEVQRLITETDLFISYNLAAKAVEPLEASLSKVPNDLRINQRLAALYVRAGRLGEAAECCRKIHDVYLKAGFHDSALQYQEAANKYAERAGETAAGSAQATAAVAGAEGGNGHQEIDISGEWESSLTQPVAQSVAKSAGGGEQAEAIASLVEEVKFYLQHELWEEAEAAIAKCEAQFPNVPELRGFREQLQARVRQARAKPRATAPVPAAPLAAAPSKGVLGEMVSDLESALGDDFGGARPVPARAPQPARMAAAAAATGGSSVPVSAPVPVLTSAPATSQVSSVASAAQADSELEEIFTEFKEGLEESDAPSQAEDPETHYNLGVAFKEMGLLDESIGELQKVCLAVERGQPFPHVMQAFTWLAQAFLEKGVPQAAIRWYEKALKLPAIDEDARIALHYELAAAYEACENKPAALSHFLEVYGANIDYRDVAERIKALKS
ncbi:MAG TPA: tetratricopeptide repeat protein [Terriglobales bacterium]|nr:tetratricopeptide repeat protein [Terriglobales bacterium]